MIIKANPINVEEGLAAYVYEMTDSSHKYLVKYQDMDAGKFLDIMHKTNDLNKAIETAKMFVES